MRKKLERLKERIKSPTFWIEVVGLGIVINVISNYIQRGLDSLMPKLFVWCQESSFLVFWVGIAGTGIIVILVGLHFKARFRVLWVRFSAWWQEWISARLWFLHVLREVAETIVPAILVAIAINFFLVQATQVQGQSMEPNLHATQRVMVEKVTYRFLHGPKRGDVVVIDLPGQTDMLIKRVIGLPGETIEIYGEKTYIEGQLLRESWSIKNAGRDYGPETIPPLHIFVMGDNRASSSDSRDFGPVHIDYVMGRAWLSYWPLEYVGLVH